ncbi:rhamnulokinase [Luteolibacter sp. AS25]|uniref:rhamnulokinase n=1 Tax=Luteolibacter sp. AS25 TaxID=3135776 RepID=UPI00398B22C3
MNFPIICLAADLGAGSGRVLAGLYDGEKLTLEEVNRFPNEPIKMESGWHWQFDKLFEEIRKGIVLAMETHGTKIASIGVDTWGVDYGLLDAEGSLLGVPYQYRDARTDGMEELAFSKMPKEDIYGRTGIQFMFFNTLFQLLAEARSSNALLEKADTILFLPDLINYKLTGRRAVERSIASTGQLLNAATQNWDTDLISAMGFPQKIFGELVDAGTDLGPMLQGVHGVPGEEAEIRVIAPGCHDTASAVAGIPAEESEPVFLSSGTWSLMGRELKRPLVSDRGFEEGFSNEAGVSGTTRFLKNIAGMWFLQESKRHWDAEGKNLGFADLVVAASSAKPFTALIDPDAPEFRAPEHMPSAITAWLEKTGQPALTEPADLTRCILESLALKYRQVKESLVELTGKPIDRIYIVGGGSQNDLLNQFAADAANCTVVAGPVEATSIGNILIQLQTLGAIDSLQEGRALVRKSFPVKTFSPAPSTAWDAAYEKFLKLQSI